MSMLLNLNRPQVLACINSIIPHLTIAPTPSEESNQEDMSQMQMQFAFPYGYPQPYGMVPVGLQLYSLVLSNFARANQWQ
jgi:hypothetical protein